MKQEVLYDYNKYTNFQKLHIDNLALYFILYTRSNLKAHILYTVHALSKLHALTLLVLYTDATRYTQLFSGCFKDQELERAQISTNYNLYYYTLFCQCAFFQFFFLYMYATLSIHRTQTYTDHTCIKFVKKDTHIRA